MKTYEMFLEQGARNRSSKQLYGRGGVDTKPSMNTNKGAPFFNYSGSIGALNTQNNRNQKQEINKLVNKKNSVPPGTI